MGSKPLVWLKWLLSLGLIAFILLALVDLPKAWAALKQAHLGYLFLLVVWVSLDRVFMSYKWRLLVICRGVALSTAEALRSYYVASFVGCFLPSTVGADALRIGAVSNADRPSSMVAASVMVERTLGFLASAVAAFVSLVLLVAHSREVAPSFLAVAGLALGLGIALVALSFSSRVINMLNRLPQHFAGRSKIAKWLGSFMVAYGQYRQHRLTLLVFTVLSVLEQSFNIIAAWLAAIALNIPITLLEAATVVPLAIILARLPIGVSGFGVVEALYMAFFALLGVAATDSFLLGFMTNVSVLVTTLPGAYLFLKGGYRSGSKNKADA